MNILTQPVLVRHVVKANREKVFNAFSNAEALSQWFSPSPDIAIEFLAFKFSENEGFRLRYSMPDGTHPVVSGTYRQIIPSKTIIFSWIWEPPDPHANIQTEVQILLRKAGEGTEIILTHDQLPTEDACIRHSNGWTETLARLAIFLTSNITIPSN